MGALESISIVPRRSWVAWVLSMDINPTLPKRESHHVMYDTEGGIYDKKYSFFFFAKNAGTPWKDYVRGLRTDAFAQTNYVVTSKQVAHSHAPRLRRAPGDY